MAQSPRPVLRSDADLAREPGVAPSATRSVDVAFWGLFLAAISVFSWLLPPNLPLMVVAYGAVVLLVGGGLRIGRGQLSGAAAVAAAAIVLRLDLSAVPLGGKLWCALAVAIGLAVFVLVPIGRSPGFPVLHIYCLLQVTYLFLGGFVARPSYWYTYRFPDYVRVDGLLYSALFMAALVGGGVVALRSRRSADVPDVADVPPEPAEPAGSAGSAAPVQPSEPPDRPQTARAAFVLLGGALFAFALSHTPLEGRLGALSDVMRLLPILGFLGLVHLWLDGALAFRWKAVVVAYAAIYGLAGIGTGLLYQAAGPFIAVMALLIVRRRRIPWALLALALTAILVLNAGKAEFRKNYRSGVPGRGIASAPEFLRATTRVLTDFDATALSQAAYRFSTSDVLGYIEDAVPGRYPYWDKRTYRAIPFSLVPRVLVPFKPSLTFTNEFGRAYGLLDPSDFVTSQNITLPVEAYVNFGVGGLIGIGLLAGVYLALVGQLVGSRSCADVILGALLTAQASSAIESGALGFILAIPFLYLLRPVARWMAPPGTGAGVAAVEARAG